VKENAIIRDTLKEAPPAGKRGRVGGVLKNLPAPIIRYPVKFGSKWVWHEGTQPTNRCTQIDCDLYTADDVNGFGYTYIHTVYTHVYFRQKVIDKKKLKPNNTGS